MNDNSCILCANQGSILEKSYLVEDLISGWRKQFDIDIRNEFRGTSVSTSFTCSECSLTFFSPAISGSEKFYAALQKFEWYYMPAKWEFAAALNDIQTTGHVLEIGCGWGEFVTQAQKQGLCIEGIELNGSAVDAAQAKGLPVSQADLYEKSVKEKGYFDVVCSFQVLEHVTDPYRFIAACLELLNEGGRLIISVPNNNTFIRYDPNGYLNLPPHHITRWSERSFEYLQKLFPLKLLRVDYEPLAEYHLNWYISIQQYRLSNRGRVGQFASQLLGVFSSKFLRPSGLYRLIRGHSIYACFQKIG